MSCRVAPIWFPGRDFGLRVLQRNRPTGWDGTPWARVVLEEAQASNLRIGGGTAGYGAIRFLRFDGRRLTTPPVLEPGDFAGYPVDWQRREPLRQP